MAHPLGDERRLKVDVRHRPPVVEGLRELERALHVFAGGLEVALPAVAPGAPAEDVGAEQVTRKVGAVREGERLVEEADRRRDARELVTAHAETEKDIRLVDRGELGVRGQPACARKEIDRLTQLAALHARPRVARKVPGLELDGARREDCRLAVLVLVDGLVVVVRLRERLRTRKQRFDTATLVGRDAALEIARVGAEALREPLDRFASRPGLSALDLADVLLREPLSCQVGLRQARGDAQLAQALAQAVARGSGAAGVFGSTRHDGLTGSKSHTSPVGKSAGSDIPLKGHVCAQIAVN